MLAQEGQRRKVRGRVTVHFLAIKASEADIVRGRKLQIVKTEKLQIG
jgi:hypothetical protein